MTTITLNAKTPEGDELQAALREASGDRFPAQVTVTNLSAYNRVLPEVETQVFAGHSTQMVEIKDADQLTRVAHSALAVIKLNRDNGGMTFEFPDVEPATEFPDAPRGHRPNKNTKPAATEASA